MDRRRGPSRGVRERLARLVELAVPWSIGLVCALTALEAPRGGAGQMAGVVLAVILGGALVWRSEHPELVTAVVLAATVPYCFLVPDMVIPFAGLAAIWSLTLARRPSVSLVGLAGLVAVSSLNGLTRNAEEAVFTIGLAFTVWALAEAARHRVDEAHEAAERAAGEEKARIARELHDVIAHSVSVIVVQAAAAGDVFDTRPDQARTALHAIEQTGREALVELRRLLGAVVPGEPRAGAPAVPAAPQPGLARLDDLAGQVRAAGLGVTVEVDEALRALPAGIDLSAYRIVQEALTNTLRHARARSVEVSVRHRAGGVEIEVVDDGRTATRGSDGHAPGHGSGYGIIGMRERAAVLGGTLEARPTAHGGFRVHALLPLDPGDLPAGVPAELPADDRADRPADEPPHAPADRPGDVAADRPAQVRTEVPAGGQEPGASSGAPDGAGRVP